MLLLHLFYHEPESNPGGIYNNVLCLLEIRGFPKLRPNKLCQISQNLLTLTKTSVGIEPKAEDYKSAA